MGTIGGGMVCGSNRCVEGEGGVGFKRGTTVFGLPARVPSPAALLFFLHAHDFVAILSHADCSKL